jgi:hypothetical protein
VSKIVVSSTDCSVGRKDGEEHTVVGGEKDRGGVEEENERGG